MMLRAERVAVRYGARVAVAPTSLELPRGTFVALTGPNGAGKSSLLKALGGLVAHDGRTSWDDRELARLDARTRARTVAYLPQAASAHWPLQTRNVVALGRLPHRALGQPETDADREAVEAAIRQTEIEVFADRAIDELSVGERARVLLARALAVRAPVLLVDEPIAALDPYHQLQIMTLLREYAAHDRAALVVAVLHDLQLAARFCSRVVLLHEGSVVGDGNPEEVLTAEALRRFYRVEAHIGRHANEPLIAPWRRVE